MTPKVLEKIKYKIKCKKKYDNVYSNILEANGKAGVVSAQNLVEFGGDVHKYFDDHVKKSVPLYEAGHNIIENCQIFCK